MFIDASALVAILGEEISANTLLGKIDASDQTIYYSSLVVFEAVIALARKKKIGMFGEHASTPPHLIERAQLAVQGFLDEIGAIEVPVPSGTYKTALDAARTYGRFVGHPAKLDFGDCFTYAAAKSLMVPPLFVGEDLARTDIDAA